jgi:hypothetical protein
MALDTSEAARWNLLIHTAKPALGIVDAFIDRRIVSGSRLIRK